MRTSLLVALAFVAGCHWDLNSKSTDPQSDQLYFPAGIAMDPGGQYVYVSNGNADLRYGGGTVMMVDMLSFECTVAAYRKFFPLTDSDAVYPMPATCNPAVDYHVLWDNAKCRRDALDPSIIICDESAFILQNSTVAVGNFAGSIRLLADPIDDLHRTLFVSVRGDPSITRVDVHFPKSTTGNPSDPMKGPMPFAPSGFDQAGVLQCVDDPSKLPTLRMNSSAPVPCDNDFLIQDYYCVSQPTCTVGVNGNGKTQLPTEPFGMQIDRTTNRLVVSHLATGQVSVIDANAWAPNALLSESSQFFPPDPTGRHGAFAVAQRDPGDPHSLWYLTSSVNPLVAMFKIADANVVTVSSQATFSLQNTFAQGTDVRDFIFDTGGNRAFVTENNPPSLLVLDTSVDNTEGAQPHNLVTDVIDICQTPSHAGVRRFTVAGAPGQPSYTKTKVIVVCFLSSQMMIVDPDRRGVDATIFSGFAGPNDIAFNFADPGDVQPIANVGVPRHAYVTNYSESTVAVVDLEPGSPYENRVLAKLGHPTDGFNP